MNTGIVAKDGRHPAHKLKAHSVTEYLQNGGFPYTLNLGKQMEPLSPAQSAEKASHS